MDGPENERRSHPSPYPGPPDQPDGEPEPDIIRMLRWVNLGWGLLQPVLLGAVVVGFLVALPFVEALQEPYVLGPSGILISVLAAAGIKRG